MGACVRFEIPVLEDLRRSRMDKQHSKPSDNGDERTGTSKPRKLYIPKQYFDIMHTVMCLSIIAQELEVMSGYGMRSGQGMHRPSSGHYQRGYSAGYGSGYGESRNYARSMMSRFSSTFDRRRRQDVNVPSRPSTPTQRFVCSMLWDYTSINILQYVIITCIGLVMLVVPLHVL